MAKKKKYAVSTDDILSKYGVSQTTGREESQTTVRTTTETSGNTKTSGNSKADSILSKYGLTQVVGNTDNFDQWQKDSDSLLTNWKGSDAEVSKVYELIASGSKYRDLYKSNNEAVKQIDSIVSLLSGTQRSIPTPEPSDDIAPVKKEEKQSVFGWENRKKEEEKNRNWSYDDEIESLLPSVNDDFIKKYIEDLQKYAESSKAEEVTSENFEDFLERNYTETYRLKKSGDAIQKYFEQNPNAYQKELVDLVTNAHNSVLQTYSALLKADEDYLAQKNPKKGQFEFHFTPKRTWFKSSEGTVGEAILGTLATAVTETTEGLVGLGEAAVDALVAVAPYFAQGQYYSNGGGYNIQADQAFNDAVGTMKAESEKFVEKDLYDEEAVAKEIIGSVASGFNVTGQKQEVMDYLNNEMEGHSVLGDKSEALLQSAGALGGQMISNAVLPGSGMVLMGTTAFGSEAENALKNGATMDEAAFSGLVSAGAEVLSERLGGISFGNETLTDVAFKDLSGEITSKLGKALLTTGKIAAGATAEGLEEIFSGYMSAIGQKLSYMEDYEIEELFSSEDALESFIGGFVLGGFGEGGDAIKSNAHGVDYVTGLTKNEQAVVDKIYKDLLAEAEKNGEVSGKDKSEIYQKVLEDLEKGGLDTDKIEEVLGGDSYKTYKDTIDSEDAQIKQLEDQLKELADAPNTVGNSKKYDSLQSQLDELKKNSQRDRLKAQLSKDVYELSKSDKLVESYFEKVRANQKFEADLNQYEGKARDVIKQVMESGLANNTNQSHEWWDMVANLAAKRNRNISVASNEDILKMVKAEHEKLGLEFDESKFEGQIIDGYVSKDGIVLNAETKRALNFVVGHEIMHTLEGNNRYKDLQKMLLKYDNAEYESRYNERAGQYANKFDDKVKDMVDREVTADLVGDLLFTDKDFVVHLAKNRNVFQKVWDEIKHLAKMATAGSEQARQLEKIKHEFEKVWNEASKAQGEVKNSADENVKYSVSEYTEEEKKAHNKAVLDHFGKTYKWAETGYVLLDGSKLDLSGKHDGAPGGYRTVDHRDITDALGSDYGGDSYSGSLVQFMSEGNIRISPESDGINLSVKPTKAQEQALSDFISRARGEVLLDIDDLNGYTVVSVEYPRGTHSSKVLNDIREWFDNGKEPQVSNVSQFRYSLSDANFTTSEIQTIQNIGRKSVNTFNSQDIAATEKFARRYWEEMGAKSPFYRAWFGDWRVNDQTPVTVATKQGDTRGVQKNTDTGWDIQVSGKVFNETRVHTDSYNVAARPYLPYINDIVKNAVLLDSYGVDPNKPKSQNSLLMHSMYAVADIGNGAEVLKLYVEEMNNPNDSTTTKRSYQLHNVEKYRLAGKSSQNTASSISPVVGSGATVADLFAFVKSEDGNFVPHDSSKIVNADGTPKVMYHGSPAQFTIFDRKKAKSSGHYGKGFYFTDSSSHAGTYGNQYSVYLNIRNPLQSGGETVSRDQVRNYLEAVAKNEDYSIENYGTYDIDEILDNVMGKETSADAFKIIQDINLTAIGDMVEAAELFNSVNGTTFDGIVVPTETVAFYPEQIKSATDNIGTFDKNNPDIHKSVSDIGQQHKPYGKWNVYAKDIMLNKGDAPVQETAPVIEKPVSESVAPVAEVTDMFPDNAQNLDSLLAEQSNIRNALEYAASQNDIDTVNRLLPEYESVSEKVKEMQDADTQRLASLDDADVPPEMDAPYYGEPQESVTPDDPFADRDWYEVGNQKVKSYMDENPIVKPFFQDEARSILMELSDTTKGERWYNDQLYYESGGEKGFGGVKRHTSDSIAELLDSWGMSYADIEKGLNEIIEDSPRKSAAAKKIEFMLNDRLLHGYKDYYTNRMVSPNQEYINLLNQIQTVEYSPESFDNLVAHADEYAPFVEDVAPVTKKQSVGVPIEDLAPTYDVVGKKGVHDGQQAFMPDAGVPKKVTRSELHKGIVDDIKSTFSTSGYDFDKVLRKAKNLSTFSTVDNTPQRVMEKALGYKEGGVLADLTVNKVAQNETEGIKWLNSFTDRKNGLLAKISKQYNIKPGSKESAAAQMYAEGFYVDENNDIIQYGDAELAKDFPNATVQKNIKGLAGDSRIRQIYDDTLAMINESRTRNAYPEIPRLDNYFLHFRAMEDTFSKLGLPFNPNDIRAKDLPTDLNGVTADLKPGQPYFASAMHRTGKRTSFDLLGGLERYLSSAKNQIYHIDDIQTLRALRNYIADTYGQANGLEGLDALSEEEAQDRIEKVYNSHLSTFAKFLNEEANILAGKTALIDRGLEGIIGRRGMTFLDTVNKQVGSNMVGWNVSSSLTNFLPVVQTFAKTNKFDFTKAFAQTVANKVGSVFGRNDGFAEISPVIVRRKGADRFYRTPWQKAGDAGYVFMSAVDDISTELIARTKYNELTRKGMDSEQAHVETDKWVSRLMGDRSIGQMPQLYNSKMLGLFTKFQLEVRNQLDSQFYDTIQEAKVSSEDIENGLARNAKTAAKVGSTFLQLAVAQHLFGKAFESVAGYNPAFDIIGVLLKAFGFDDDEDSEDTALDNIEQGFLELLGDLPYTSTLTGGRIPISSALPVEQFITGKDQYGNEKSRWDTLKEVAPYYLLPGGYGQVKKTAQGLGMFSEDHPIAGSYTDSGKLRFPVEDTIGNRVQAGIFGQWASENARDYFDNERKALTEEQIQEFIDLDVPIQDYWEYREGLSGLKTLAEKADYIMGLDLPLEKKNLLVNNLSDREDPIDLEGYEEYGSFEDFDFAQKYPEKYDFLKEHNISVSEYNSFDEETKSAYTWASKNPEKYVLSQAVSDDFLTYYKYKGELNDIRADKDSKGDTIVGSAKEKKLDYINNLDLEYGQKIILFKSLYNADDTYNYEIIDYLNSREDIDYEEMETILKELGFDVSSDGTITWD